MKWREVELAILKFVFAVLILASPLFLAIAALGKMLAWPDYEQSILHLVVLPILVRQIAVVTLPGLELVPLLLVLARRPISGLAVSVFLVTVFSGVVLWQYGIEEQPQCACLGAWIQYEWVQKYFGRVFLRNTVLIALSACGMAVAGRRSHSKGILDC